MTLVLFGPETPPVGLTGRVACVRVARPDVTNVRVTFSSCSVAHQFDADFQAACWVVRSGSLHVYAASRRPVLWGATLCDWYPSCFSYASKALALSLCHWAHKGLGHFHSHPPSLSLSVYICLSHWVFLAVCLVCLNISQCLCPPPPPSRERHCR